MFADRNQVVLPLNVGVKLPKGDPVFKLIKQNFGFRRFLTRGKPKVETQFFLIAFAFNIEKLCNRIESNRFGKSLFDIA